MRKRIVPLLATIAVAVLVLLASGQSGPLAADQGGQSLEGSWKAIVTPDPPLPPGTPSEFVNLATFTADGGFISTSGSVTDSLAHGAWVRTGDRRFAVTCVGLSYGASGTTEYMWKMRATLAYTENRLELTGRWAIDIGDANGDNWTPAPVSTGTARLLPINVEKMP